MPHAPFRLLRTTLVGATIFGLAAAAHLVAGGTLPAPRILAAILALHILCSTVATMFKLNLPAMLALLASSQVVLHQSFDSLSHSAHAVAVTGAQAQEQAQALSHHGMSAEGHAAAMLSTVMAPDLSSTMASGMSSGMASSVLEALSHSGPLSLWMWAAHIAATLAAAGLLAYGENALWSLANWLRPLYQRAAAVLVIPAQSTRPTVVPRPLPRQPWRNLRPNTRRGPPLSVAAFA